MNRNDAKDDDVKDYNNLPNDSMNKDPEEEGDVLHQDDETPAINTGQAQDMSRMPDSPLTDMNEEEANGNVPDAKESE